MLQTPTILENTYNSKPTDKIKHKNPIIKVLTTNDQKEC